MADLMYSTEKHIQAMKKIYPVCDEKTKEKLKNYADLIKLGIFDDFDEHLLMIDLCTDYFKVPIIYTEKVFMNNNNEYEIGKILR